MKKKTCAICGKEKPEDKKNFRWRVQNGKGYYTAECLECIAEAKKVSKAKKEAKRQEALLEIEKAGVDVFLSSVSRGGANVPHTAEVVERVMSYFGGVGGFSSVLVKQYWDSDPGGSQRNKLLETITRLISKNVESGGAKKPLQLWSEEELEAELNRRLHEAVAEFNGVIINATPEEAPKNIGRSDTGELAGTDNAVPKRLPQRDTERVEGQEAGGLEALQAEHESGEDSPDESE
tara:strand:- start:292 stop:996 length:705 start_codon:yes stop_codon:yes gene_type:complete